MAAQHGPAHPLCLLACQSSAPAAAALQVLSLAQHGTQPWQHSHTSAGHTTHTRRSSKQWQHMPSYFTQQDYSISLDMSTCNLPPPSPELAPQSPSDIQPLPLIACPANTGACTTCQCRSSLSASLKHVSTDPASCVRLRARISSTHDSRPHLVKGCWAPVHGMLVAATVVALVHAHPPALWLGGVCWCLIGPSINPGAHRSLCQLPPPCSCCTSRQQQCVVNQCRRKQLPGATFIPRLLNQLRAGIHRRLGCCGASQLSTQCLLNSAESYLAGLDTQCFSKGCQTCWQLCPAAARARQVPSAS